MKALVLHSDKSLKYGDIDLQSHDGWIRVRVTYSGICGSDIERGFHGKAYHYPLVMGHEFAGVAETGGIRVKAGDRVAVFPLIPCGTCAACETGNYALCKNYNYLGSRCDGGFAEYVYAPEENLIAIPDYVKSEHAAMTEPCAVALHGVNKFHITPGDIGCVYGGGPIGNIAAQWLRVRGCGTVIVVEIDERKLAIARQMGFAAVNPKDGDPVTAIQSVTGGRLADHVVEACGFPETFLNAVRSAGDFGEVLFMGNIKGTFGIPEAEFTKILRKELTIFGTWNSKVTPAGHNDWTAALSFMGRGIDCAPLISHIAALRDGAAMFDTIVGKKEFVNKAIFRIHAE
ncbi:MAG: galactitol-1-phosphate 5-dehydrogenase [Spirochaetes bacterium]|nr:galactitol-1-phosphate 5-dehydrogenase [Spirochaetota bacterium]